MSIGAERNHDSELCEGFFCQIGEGEDLLEKVEEDHQRGGADMLISVACCCQRVLS